MRPAATKQDKKKKQPALQPKDCVYGWRLHYRRYVRRSQAIRTQTATTRNKTGNGAEENAGKQGNREAKQKHMAIKGESP